MLLSQHPVTIIWCYLVLYNVCMSQPSEREGQSDYKIRELVQNGACQTLVFPYEIKNKTVMC